MDLIHGLVIAFATYSRIPMPRVDWSDEDRRHALCFLPLVGTVVGIAVWLWLFLCDRLPLSPLFRGAVGAVIPLLLTGGIHMDGFLDTSDALASWQPPQKRLEILKDSHVGSGAVMTCAMYILLYAAVLGETEGSDGSALALCYIASRAVSAWTSVILRRARPGGMLDSFACKVQKKTVSVVCGLVLVACIVGWLLLCQRGVLPLLALGGCVFVYWRMAYRLFGGVTGDLAGWFTQVSELCMLAAIVIGGKL